MLCNLHCVHHARILVLYTKPQSEVRYRLGLHRRCRCSLPTQFCCDYSKSRAIYRVKDKAFVSSKGALKEAECALEAVFMVTEFEGFEAQKTDL